MRLLLIKVAWNYIFGVELYFFNNGPILLIEWDILFLESSNHYTFKVYRSYALEDRCVQNLI